MDRSDPIAPFLLCAPAPLRETPHSTAPSPIPPPRRCVTSSRAPSSVTAGTEEWKSGQANDAMPRSEPVDSQLFWARRRFVKWTDLTPLPLPALDAGWTPLPPERHRCPSVTPCYAELAATNRKLRTSYCGHGIRRTSTNGTPLASLSTRLKASIR
jgi:hypothetical protein